MKIRLAKKIMKKVPPNETSSKSRAFWYRYWNASRYVDSLYRKIIKRRGKDNIISEYQLNEIMKHGLA